VFFDSWVDVGRVLVRGSIAYLSLVLILRISGKRTLSKMNAFDLVVTVALGSTLAAILASTDLALAEGLASLAFLIAAQYVISKMSMKSTSVRRLAKSAPTPLVHNGELLEHALRASRVTEGELHQAVRASGYGDLEGIAAVVLETDGSLSVISHSNFGVGDALRDVQGPMPRRRRSDS
jgi:uncharacterized membrane protein YcaP (DUF421 family)